MKRDLFQAGAEKKYRECCRIFAKGLLLGSELHRRSSRVTIFNGELSLSVRRIKQKTLILEKPISQWVRVSAGKPLGKLPRQLLDTKTCTTHAGMTADTKKSALSVDAPDTVLIYKLRRHSR